MNEEQKAWLENLKTLIAAAEAPSAMPYEEFCDKLEELMGNCPEP